MINGNGYKTSFRNEVILVTGGAGAIGSNLTRELAECGAKKVMVLDDLSSAQRWNIPSHQNILFVEGSILDEVLLKRVFFEEPSYVFHLAAFFANQNSVDHPECDLTVNGLGTLKLLQYAKMAQVKRFVYASSGCSIYGSDAPLPLREDFMSIHLSSPYQITKMLGELYCNYFAHHYGMSIVRTRFFNSYGPGEIPGAYRNVIPNFVYWGLQGKPLPITGTGEETRDFTFVGDIVDGLLRAGYFPGAIGQEMNLASGVETKIIDLAKQINALTENEAGFLFSDRRKWDTKSRLRASVDRAKQLIGYEPKTTFELGIRETVGWFRKNWDQIHTAAKFAPGMSPAVNSFLAK